MSHGINSITIDHTSFMRLLAEALLTPHPITVLVLTAKQLHLTQPGNLPLGGELTHAEITKQLHIRKLGRHGQQYFDHPEIITGFALGNSILMHLGDKYST